MTGNISAITTSASPGIVPANSEFVSIDPIIPVFEQIVSEIYMSRHFVLGARCLDSIFLNMTITSLKTLPYAYLSKNAIMQNFDNGISCRLRYLEAGMIALASSIYNLAFAWVFSALSLMTFGRVKIVTDEAGKHWVNAGLSVASVAIGIIGTFSPWRGILANGFLGYHLVIFLRDSTTAKIVQEICGIYLRHRIALQEAVMRGTRPDPELNAKALAFFNDIDTYLNQRGPPSPTVVYATISAWKTYFFDPNSNLKGWSIEEVWDNLQQFSRLFTAPASANNAFHASEVRNV